MKSLAIAYGMKKKAKKMADGGLVGKGSGNSPTDTKTQTGGSSPGGASTGGVGSGIGGAGTGGAATGGASTGGAGTITITVGPKTKVEKGAINISHVGGKTESEGVTSGDGPGSSGTGGSGEGSGGGGGGAAPSEPEDMVSKIMKKRKMAMGGML